MAISYRILHVDDDPLMRDLVALSFETDPALLLLSCDSGAEALRVAPDWAPDLVLCDVMMPDMDGETLIARLAADPATAGFPVAVMSACAAFADGTGVPPGAAAVIAKPFDPATLAATVRRHLHTIKLNAAGYDFRQRLERDAATLAAFRRRLADDAPPQELQSFVHRLAGAAGIFDCREVSVRASALEMAIAASRAGRAEPRSVADGIDALIASIARA